MALSMRKRIKTFAVLALLSSVSACHSQDSDVLSVRIGKPYAQVVESSSFPVDDHSHSPLSNSDGLGSTWVDRPSVIIQFDDPQHGFSLPPTLFAAIGYSHSKVVTITTSPMLETLPIEPAVALLAELQARFKNAGWRPVDREGNDWLDTSLENRVGRRGDLFIPLDSVELQVPGKYAMYLNFKCYARCDERNSDTAKYLIDVGIGRDWND
jgi:hypothetical protein